MWVLMCQACCRYLCKHLKDERVFQADADILMIYFIYSKAKHHFHKIKQRRGILVAHCRASNVKSHSF